MISRFRPLVTRFSRANASKTVVFVESKVTPLSLFGTRLHSDHESHLQKNERGHKHDGQNDFKLKDEHQHGGGCGCGHHTCQTPADPSKIREWINQLKAHNPAQQLQALKKLSEILPQDSEALRSYGGLSPLIDMIQLQTADESADVQLKARASMVLMLACEDSRNRVEVKRLNGLGALYENLLTCVQAVEEDRTLQATRTPQMDILLYSLGCLSYCASQSIDFAVDLRNLDALPLFHHLLSFPQPPVQAFACDLLTSCTHDRESTDLLQSMDVIPDVLKLLTSQGTEPSVQIAALQFFSYFVRDPLNAQRMKELGGVDVLKSFMADVPEGAKPRPAHMKTLAQMALDFVEFNSKPIA